MNYKMTPRRSRAQSVRSFHIYGVSAKNASDDEFYKASALVVRDLLVRGRDEFVHEAEKQETKANLLPVHGVPAGPLPEEQPV